MREKARRLTSAELHSPNKEEGLEWDSRPFLIDPILLASWAVPIVPLLQQGFSAHFCHLKLNLRFRERRGFFVQLLEVSLEGPERVLYFSST